MGYLVREIMGSAIEVLIVAVLISHSLNRIVFVFGIDFLYCHELDCWIKIWKLVRLNLFLSLNCTRIKLKFQGHHML